LSLICIVLADMLHLMKVEFEGKQAMNTKEHEW